MSNRRCRLFLVTAAACALPVFAAAQTSPGAAEPPATTASSAAGDHRSPFENVEFFAGLDGSKQPQDLGINANMGIRLTASAAIPLLERARLGLQVGVGVNLSDAAVHVLDQVEGTSRRSQTFLTVGLFQQALSRFTWALVYDFVHEHYYDTFSLGQLRGQAGAAVTASDEIGARVTAPIRGAAGRVGETAVRLDPMTIVTGYLRHTWLTGARTMAWAGIAAHHQSVVLVFPGDTRDNHVVVYGAQLELPLSPRVSVTGSGNFVTPTATGAVDAYLGLSIFPGRGRTGRDRLTPPLAVANNPEFPVDLSRR